MIMTKSDVKIAIKRIIKKKIEPFTTSDITEEIKPLTKRDISLSPHRLKNYIRATKLVEFNKNKKKWSKKV